MGDNYIHFTSTNINTYLVGCGLCALCFLVVEVLVRRGGGSAPNSKKKIKKKSNGIFKSIISIGTGTV